MAPPIYASSRSKIKEWNLELKKNGDSPPTHTPIPCFSSKRMKRAENLSLKKSRIVLQAREKTKASVMKRPDRS